MNEQQCSVPGCHDEAAVELVKEAPGQVSYPYLCATHVMDSGREKPLGQEYHFLR